MSTVLFFGSFNPFHNAHYKIARFVIENQLADNLWFIVSPHNPLKDTDILIDSNHRLKMLNLIVNKHSEFQVCDIEYHLSLPSFTVNTLKKLKELYPQINFDILIGSDSLDQIHLWKDYRFILEHYKLLVFPRQNNYKIPQQYCQYNIILLNTDVITLSSTFIREKAKKKEDISELIPECIYKYMKINSLM